MKAKLYFQHDYNARNDLKIVKLMRVHGLAGIGAYWCIIEHLYTNGGISSLEECESIAFSLHADTDLILSVIKNFDLFQNDGVMFWSDGLNKRLSRRKEVSKSRKKAAVKRWEDANAMQMQCKCNANAEQVHFEEKNEPVKEEDEKHKKCKTEGVKDANAMQMHQKTMQMQCKKNDLIYKDINNNNITSIDIEVSETVVSAKVDFSQIVRLYHEKCKSYPRIVKLTDSRKRKVKIRFVDEMKGDYGLLESVFAKMEESKFLRGDNARGWKATFDWLFSNDKNWVKVAEGVYDNKPQKRNETKNCNDEWE